MKKLFFLTVINFCCCEIAESSWKIGTIYNDSDLVLESAWYIKPSRGESKQRYIDFLSTRLKKAVKNKEKKVVFDYRVAYDSHGCSFIQTKEGYQIVFDSKSPYRVHYPKPKDNSPKKYVGKDVCYPGKDNFCARVFLEKESLVSYVAHAYQKEDATFDVYLTGKDGTYQLRLILVKS